MASNICQALDGDNVFGGGFDIGLGISLEVELKAQLERRSARLGDLRAASERGDPVPEAGGVFTGPASNQRPESARLYEHLPRN